MLDSDNLKMDEAKSDKIDIMQHTFSLIEYLTSDA